MKRLQHGLYCGPPSAGFSQIFGANQIEGVHTWFGRRTVYYTHKARVAIRRACAIMSIGEGDEVLAPAYNCGSEIDALLSSGISTVLYRVDKSGQADLADLRNRLTERAKAVYVTHYFGFSQPVDDIKSICDENGLYLIEDCALSLFSSNGTLRLGSVGDISVFNFPKTLPVPDGGAMVITNPNLAVDSWSMRTPPISRVLREMLPLTKRCVLRMSSDSNFSYALLWSVLKKKQSMNNHDHMYNPDPPDMPSSYYYDEKLNNRKMSKITERILRTFGVSEIINKRRINFLKYLDMLSGVRGIELLYKKLPFGVCPLYFPVIVDQRMQVCQKLNALSIEVIPWWAGYHRSLPWTEYPDACFLKDNILVLPVHQQLTVRHIEFICQMLMDIIHSIKPQTLSIDRKAVS